MSKRRKKKSHTRGTAFRSFGIGALLSALVALTAWAHQQGLIDWQLPSSAVTAATSDGVIVATAAIDPDGLGETAGASPENCAAQFFDGKAPRLTNDRMAAKTNTLCYTGFAVLNSGVTRTPLWAAEHLTAERVARARDLPRQGEFHADPNLAADERAELADYKNSGFDRGHMAPNADMPDAKSQAECFTLANIAPQNAENNRGVWKEIEAEVRALAAAKGDIYVVTGPIFDGDEVELLNERVMAPTHFFKAVYDVKQRKGAAYVVRNAPGNAYETVSLTKLEGLAGVEAFPGLPPAAIGELALPPPIEKRPG
jgi:endonuclease G